MLQRRLKGEIVAREDSTMSSGEWQECVGVGGNKFAMHIDLVNSTQNFIRAAVIEHLRHWWGGDGLYYDTLCREPRNTSKIDPLVLRKIAQSYGVGRGILSDQEKAIALYLDIILADWPEKLPDRARRVNEAAEYAENQQWTKGKLLSGFSKIIWFAKPERWTMYDSFARRGLAAGCDGDDFIGYYEKLANLGFDETVALCNGIIRRSAFPYLWPERILDKYLMLCGHDQQKNLTVVGADAHPAIVALWARFHGKEMVSQLEILVNELVEAIGNRPLFKIHCKVQLN